jgi:hypothetical protein
VKFPGLAAYSSRQGGPLCHPYRNACAEEWKLEGIRLQLSGPWVGGYRYAAGGFPRLSFTGRPPLRWGPSSARFALERSSPISNGKSPPVGHIDPFEEGGTWRFFFITCCTIGSGRLPLAPPFTGLRISKARSRVKRGKEEMEAVHGILRTARVKRIGGGLLLLAFHRFFRALFPEGVGKLDQTTKPPVIPG